ncbi:MAG TPA: hypothetical protein VGB63_16900 [Pedobacter sp.]|jgi:hypothetical protein
MKLFRTYLVLALAMLITLSASGINISLHKCCGSIQSLSLLGSAKECKMESKTRDCAPKSKTHVHKGSCCSNQKVSFAQSSEKISLTTKTEIKQNEHNFDVLFFYTIFKNWFSTTEAKDKIEKPSPGLFIREALLLLLQQFRI